MSFEKGLQHLKTINRHKASVMESCFRMGLVRQGLLHDLSKYAPVEFLVGARYYQGDRSPNNAEREDLGLSYSWLHHKGINKHHFEYWLDYGIQCDTIIKGVPIPRKYVAEMIADRIAASKVYLGDSYSVTSPYTYLDRSLDHLWFVHDEVKEQLRYLLGMLAVRGETQTFAYIRRIYLKDRKQPWTRPEDFDTIIQAADEAVQKDTKTKAAMEHCGDSVTA